MFRTVDITWGHDDELKICCAADLRATSLEEGKISECVSRKNIGGRCDLAEVCAVGKCEKN